MHAVQINFLPAPEGCTSAETLRQWPSLADIAEAAASAGTRITVIQAAAHEEQVTHNGVDYLFTDVSAMRTAPERGRHVAHLLGALGADVAHVHSLGFAQSAHAMSQCVPRLPILIQDHADRVPRWWRRPSYRRWYRAAAGVAFTANELAQAFVRAGLFDPCTRLYAIPESSSRFTPGSRAQARGETGLHGAPCIVWVGHLSPGKDPLTVLDGIAQAAAQLPGLQLWCAFGNAPLIEQVRHRIEGDPRLKGRVHLLGRIEHARIEAWMRAADLFVSGSRSESCGYACLEALACGAMPVVTDIPSFRALAGGIGKLWSCGDASALARALIEAAANRPSPEQVRAHFDATLSFSAIGRRWADAYAQLLADVQRGVP